MKKIQKIDFNKRTKKIIKKILFLKKLPITLERKLKIQKLQQLLES